MMAAQLFNTALKKIPNLQEDFKKGDFSKLKEWLSETPELIKRATGSKPNPEFLIKHLKKEYNA